MGCIHIYRQNSMRSVCLKNDVAHTNNQTNPWRQFMSRAFCRRQFAIIRRCPEENGKLDFDCTHFTKLLTIQTHHHHHIYINTPVESNLWHICQSPAKLAHTHMKRYLEVIVGWVCFYGVAYIWIWWQWKIALEILWGSWYYLDFLFYVPILSESN